MSELATYRGTGKRKTSVARVILRPGDGTTWINGRTLEDYFPRATHLTLALSPLKTAEAEGRYDLPLKRQGFLTRDARIVERKKAGLHKARKAPQFSKR